MKAVIVGSSKFGLTRELFEKHYEDGNLLIAADGGYGFLKDIGIEPDYLIGDLDSYSGETGTVKVIGFPSEKDESDLELAIEHAIGLGADRVAVLGATGGRLDHFMAAAFLIFAYDAEILIADEGNEISRLGKGTVLSDDSSIYFSVIPLEKLDCLTIRGARYELNCAEVEPFRSQTISNETKGITEIQSSGEKALLIKSKKN